MPMKVMKLTTVAIERSVLTSNSMIDISCLFNVDTQNLQVGNHCLHLGLASNFGG